MDEQKNDIRKNVVYWLDLKNHDMFCSNEMKKYMDSSSHVMFVVNENDELRYMIFSHKKDRQKFSQTKNEQNIFISDYFMMID